MSPSSDTIIAIASGPEGGPVGIIRLSGPHAQQALQRVFRKTGGAEFKSFKPRYMHYGEIRTLDHEILDSGLGVVMPCPHSFTGEDVVEFQGHGNRFLMDQVVREFLHRCQDLSLRLARPGEFLKRAFRHGKLDLIQAESVHDAITAQSEMALKGALQNLSGALSVRVTKLRDQLRLSLALVEASFEFVEEDIQTFDRQQLVDQLQAVQRELHQLSQCFQTSQILERGVQVAIVGPPNVGKSSLLNRLLQEERALVTDIAGTTRDVVTGEVHLKGVRFIFRDTAGLRETSDVVEALGIERSKQWINKADLVLFLRDSLKGESLSTISRGQALRVLNKVDVLSVSDKNRALSDFDVMISALTGEGIEELVEKLIRFAGNINVQNYVHINQRQNESLTTSQKIIEKLFGDDPNSRILPSEEFLAEGLREAIEALEEVIGTVTRDDVLGEIFQKFCIGK